MTHSDKIKLGLQISKTHKALRLSEINGIRNTSLRAELRLLNKQRRA